MTVLILFKSLFDLAIGKDHFMHAPNLTGIQQSSFLEALSILVYINMLWENLKDYTFLIY